MKLRKRGVLSTPNILINHSLIFLEYSDHVTALIHIVTSATTVPSLAGAKRLGWDDVLHRL